MTLSIIKIIGAGHLFHVPLYCIGHASKFQVYFFQKSCENLHKRYVFFKLAFTPRKDGQPLQGKTLQEKEV